MTHTEAKSIIKDYGAEIKIDESEGFALINGIVSIEELQAILQLLECTA